MIEITLAQLRSPQFSQAYQKLMHTGGLAPKTVYHIARVGTMLEQEQKIANDEYDKLVKKWAEFKNENGQDFWKVPEEKLTEWNLENKSFHEAIVTIDKYKIKLAEIEKAALTPAEFLALEPVLDEGTALQVVKGVPDGEKTDEKNS